MTAPQFLEGRAASFASVYTGEVPRKAPMNFRSTAMGKVRKGNKEVKKQPAMSSKEKKAAKQAKKHASDIVPLITR